MPGEVAVGYSTDSESINPNQPFPECYGVNPAPNSIVFSVSSLPVSKLWRVDYNPNLDSHKPYHVVAVKPKTGQTRHLDSAPDFYGALTEIAAQIAYDL